VPVPGKSKVVILMVAVNGRREEVPGRLIFGGGQGNSRKERQPCQPGRTGQP
jgi:hypothetical protein